MDGDELRVPTVPTEVTLILGGGRRETVMLYLASASRKHEGPESLLEFLNRAGTFVPVKLSTGDSALVGRDTIRCVIAARDTTHEELGIPSIDLVRVQMGDLPDIEGVLRHVDPHDRSRLSDHFNHADRFFAVESGETVHYVHKLHVLFIVS